MEVATTERHWNDTSVPERPELEVFLLEQHGSILYGLPFLKLHKLTNPCTFVKTYIINLLYQNLRAGITTTHCGKSLAQ